MERNEAGMCASPIPLAKLQDVQRSFAGERSSSRFLGFTAKLRGHMAAEAPFKISQQITATEEDQKAKGLELISK